MELTSNLPPDLDPNILHINATIDPESLQPQVVWAHKGNIGVMGLNLARDRAKTLFEAAAVAEAEAIVFKTFVGLEMAASGKQKGFGTYKPSPFPVEVMKLLRAQRPKLPEDVEIIFGLQSKLPIVNLYWYQQKTQLELDEVRTHANQLLLAAEAAESDGFFYNFLHTRLDIPLKEAYGLIQEFGQYRDRRRLDELFQKP